MLEPVVADRVAWLWLEQALTTAQVIGGLVVLAGVALAQAARPDGGDQEPIPDAAPCSVPAMSIYDVSINRLDGSPADLHDYEGKAVLLVNVASQCGLTPQYTGLEELQERTPSGASPCWACPATSSAARSRGRPRRSPRSARPTTASPSR